MVSPVASFNEKSDEGFSAIEMDKLVAVATGLAALTVSCLDHSLKKCLRVWPSDLQSLLASDGPFVTIMDSEGLQIPWGHNCQS